MKKNDLIYKIIAIELVLIIILSAFSFKLLKNYENNRYNFLVSQKVLAREPDLGKPETAEVPENISAEEPATEILPIEESATAEEKVQDNVTEQVEAAEGTLSESSSYIDPTKDNEINIVVYGDSIWDFNRNDGSIAEKLQGKLQAAFPGMPVKIYNLAVGGTCAAVIEGAFDPENWNSQSLPGLIYTIDGKIDPSKNYYETNMYPILPEVDYGKIDYFIINYGVNDYFFANKIEPEGEQDLLSYKGSLGFAIQELQTKFPDSRQLIIGPSYCQFYYYDDVIDTCLTRTYSKDDYQGETLDKYVEAARSVAGEYNTLFLDSMNDFGLGAESQKECSRDGVHFNEKGREIYAENVFGFLMQDLQ